MAVGPNALQEGVAAKAEHDKHQRQIDRKLKQLSRVESSLESSLESRIESRGQCNCDTFSAIPGRGTYNASVRVALMAGKSPTINAQHVGADKARSLSPAPSGGGCERFGGCF